MDIQRIIIYERKDGEEYLHEKLANGDILLIKKDNFEGNKALGIYDPESSVLKGEEETIYFLTPIKKGFESCL